MRNFKKWLAVCIAIVLVLTPNLFVFAGEPEARNLSVFRVDGDDAFLARALHGRGTVPREGQRLSLGNVMQTGLDTQVYMQLDAASIVKQDEFTYVAVSAAGNLLSLSVLRGSALVDVAEMEPGQTLETRIGSTVMSVRGTIFTAAIREGGATVITMLSGEGAVLIGGAEEEIPLAQGYVFWAHDVEAHETFELRPIDPFAMSLFELQEVQNRSEYLLEIGTITPAMQAQLQGLINNRQIERDNRRQTQYAAFADFHGDALQVISETPVPHVEQALAFVSGQQTVSANMYNSFAIRDGSLLAWGQNWDGGFGDGAASLSPIYILDNVIAVSAGSNHTAVIRGDGSLWTWGANSSGQLGDGSTIPRNHPVRILDDVIAVSAGHGHTAAIRSDGSLWTWGSNWSGQLGDGTTTARYSPTRIIDNVSYVTVGRNHTVAIRDDGSLWAWGANWNSELGDGTATARYSPIRIMDNVVAVSAGSYHTVAVRTDGSLWAWGANWNGEVGDGTTTAHHSPVRIMDNVVAVSASTMLTTAIRSDGSLWSWGWNGNGQLGNGTTTRSLIPVRIMENVTYVSAGPYHSIAVRSDGSVWAWGANSFGQLGDGTTVNRLSPVQVIFP